jgi:hypothetical protein
VSHLAAQLDQRIQDPLGCIDRGEHLFLVGREGEDFAGLLRVPLWDAGL